MLSRRLLSTTRRQGGISKRLGVMRQLANASDRPEQRAYIESNGDYRADAALLEDVNRPLYCEQANLPRLPVPSLQETIDTFLPTALPFCKDEQERNSLLEAAQSFPFQAAPLQARLLQRQMENQDSSWLQEWWNKIGYLQYRSSNVIHASYFFRLGEDPVATSMAQRGAAILQTAARFSQGIQDGGSRSPDRVPQRKHGASPIPLCSSQYKYIFSSCRIPREEEDTYRVFQRKKHAVVVVHGHFFMIPVTDDGGNLLSRKTLESLLEDTIDRKVSDKVPELGWLTATNRDRWAGAYKVLESSPVLSRALEDLQSGLCLLCLDVDEASDSTTSESQEEKDREVALRLWHGNGKYSSNRWFDKSMQITLSDAHDEYHLGYIGEHALADGMPAIGFCRALLTEGSCSSTDPEGVTSDTPTGVEPIFEKAFEEIPDSERQPIEKLVEEAREEFLANIAKHSLHVQLFTDYGKNAIKECGYSPDGFVQMAMQLAGRRVFGKTVGTYESTQTRRFLHGRTETTRSVSLASRDFCDSMLSGSNKSLQEKQELLHAAVQNHVEYTQKALVGLGVDRHFFGLSMLQQKDEDVPDLFRHPIYAESKKWLMSTSTLPNTAPGFGNVEPDGVGIGYDILDDRCVFTVTSEKENGLAFSMKSEIGHALRDMQVFLNSRAPQRNRL